VKKWISFILVVVFSFVNAFSFIGCKKVSAKEEREVRACWVASIGNLDFPSRMGLSVASMKAEIDAIIENCRRYGLNTVFFQVRPNGDALYKSEVFPWSIYLTGKQGRAPADGFDPLAYFVKAAHGSKIELHAWINPYRIGSGDKVWEGLSADNPAVLHPEYTVTSKTGVYYDPGLPEARELIISGVKELVLNYEIDGIHFDDYFYPYDLGGFDDSDTYAKYGKGLPLDDFRRQSVDLLVQSVYKEIKGIKSDVQFGISPFGIWANKWIDPAGSDTRGMSSYAAIFSDSKKWVEEGWLDYICPQIYWTNQHTAAPFDVLVDWWDDLCSRNGMPLYIGMALYKVGEGEVGFDDGAVMGDQLRYASAKRSYAGHCFFRYGLLSKNPKGALDAILAYYDGAEDTVEMESVDFLQLNQANELKITAPQSGASVQGEGISVAGTSRPGASVTVNGVQAVVSSRGLFAAYVPLKLGKNTVTVQSGGEKRTVQVIRTAIPAVKTVGDLYPSGTVHRSAGDHITFTVSAPSGAQVILTNGTVAIPLSPAKSGATTYHGAWTAPVFPAGDKLELSDFSLEMTLNGQKTVKKTDLTVCLYAAGYSENKLLQQDAYIFDESSGGSQMDHDPLRRGTRVRVVGLEGTRALLENGYWVEAEALGDEQPEVAEPADYKYEILNFTADEIFGYSSFCNGASLEISISAGCAQRIESDAERADHDVHIKSTAQGSLITIRSRGGRHIAGYEILQRKNRITVYLRFHDGSLVGKKIMLDAGHGGQDSGAFGPGGAAWPAESELNMVLTHALKAELEAAGATVLMTRVDNSTVTLAERAEQAVAAAPDLFISLHHNSTSETGNFAKATGGLMLYSSPISESLAKVLSGNLRFGVGENSSRCRRQSLYVCRQTRFPAVLVEAGYVCNPLEYEMLCEKDNVMKMAKNIRKGIEAYFVTVCS